jgi:hypothetical protein
MQHLTPARLWDLWLRHKWIAVLVIGVVILAWIALKGNR